MTEAWVEYLTGPYGFVFAFAAGVLSFLSPCVLPLVPAYLAHLTGTASTLNPRSRADERRETVTHAAAFVLGFTVVFTIVGASVGLLGAIVSADSSYAIRDHLPLLGKIGGVFLIIMGLNLIGVIKIPFLYRTYSFETATSSVPVAVGAGARGGSTTSGSANRGNVALGDDARGRAFGLNYAKSFGVGAAFAVGWTPCIGPVLGSILTLSASSASVAKGTYLLLVYSLGLGVPFILTGMAVVPATAFLRRMRGAMPLVEIATGALVIFVGVLIFANELTVFNGYFSDIPGLDRFNQI